MPTIEIASIKAPHLNIDQTDFELAILEEPKLEGHRDSLCTFPGHPVCKMPYLKTGFYVSMPAHCLNWP